MPYIFFQLSIVLLQNYDPPILACAVNEVLASITGEQSSSLPTFLVPAPKLKWEVKNSAPYHKNVLYGLQIGPETETTRALAARTEKSPSCFQIHHEPLAIFIQLARVLKLPTFVLIGQSGTGEELEVLVLLLISFCSDMLLEIVQILANQSTNA